jgi:hypothetical protein
MVNYTVKTIKGRKYVYSQESVDGKQKEKYLGSYAKPEIQSLLNTKKDSKITKNEFKITGESKENLIEYKKQVLADILEIEAVFQNGSIDQFLIRLQQWEKKLQKEVQDTDKA